MTPDAPQQALPKLPTSVPQAPVFGNMPNKKPQAKSATPSFLGAAAIANPTNTGMKTLTGQ
jgi:hypothetical protein